MGERVLGSVGAAVVRTSEWSGDLYDRNSIGEGLATSMHHLGMRNFSNQNFSVSKKHKTYSDLKLGVLTTCWKPYHYESFLILDFSSANWILSKAKLRKQWEN